MRGEWRNSSATGGEPIVNCKGSRWWVLIDLPAEAEHGGHGIRRRWKEISAAWGRPKYKPKLDYIVEVGHVAT